MYVQDTVEGVDVPAPAGEATEQHLNAVDQQPVRRTMGRVPRNWPVNTIADERGFRLLVSGLIDVLVFEEAGVAHVSIGPAGSLDDDYPLIVRVDGRIVVNRV